MQAYPKCQTGQEQRANRRASGKDATSPKTVPQQAGDPGKKYIGQRADKAHGDEPAAGMRPLPADSQKDG